MSRAASYYRRPLPAGQIAFSSDEGKRLFRESLAAGSLEGFFSLSEQFHTQAEGPWRWFDESLLDCCVPLDEVRAADSSVEALRAALADAAAR